MMFHFQKNTASNWFSEHVTWVDMQSVVAPMACQIWPEDWVVWDTTWISREDWITGTVLLRNLPLLISFKHRRNVNFVQLQIHWQRDCAVFIFSCLTNRCRHSSRQGGYSGRWRVPEGLGCVWLQSPFWSLFASYIFLHLLIVLDRHCSKQCC